MSIQELSKDLIEATKKVLTKEEEYKDFFKKAMKKSEAKCHPQKAPRFRNGDKSEESIEDMSEDRA